AQLRRRDELERAGDLARVGDGANPPLEILNRSQALSSLSRGSAQLTRQPLLLLDVEALREALECLLELRHRLVAEALRPADGGVDRALRPERFAELLLEARHLGHRHRVEIAVDAGPDRDDLLLEGPWLVLRLIQRRHHPLPAGKGLLRGRIELRPELRER